MAGAENIMVENDPPIISDIKITKSAGKYTITAKVTDDYGIDRVMFPTWTDANGQDDLIWHKGTVSGGTVTCTIDMKDHNYESGKYNTHIYVYDKAGLLTVAGAEDIMVENQSPVINSVTITNVTSLGYTVNCYTSDDYGMNVVKFPTWTENNGQDDLIWGESKVINGVASFRVNIKDHGYNYGKYITHIYAYDLGGNYAFANIEQVLEMPNSAPGWMQQNGRKYLFDKDGKLVEGGRYFVIDISKWQGNIDWDTVMKKNSIDAVILRVSHGDETTESNGKWQDEKFTRNIAELNRLGVPYGIYHYNTAKNTAQAVHQAELALSLIKSAGAKPTLPVYADIEEGGNDRDQVAIAKVYCEAFKRAGYTPGVYANLNYWKNHLKNDSSLNNYAKWIANYGLNNGLPRSDWRPDDSFKMWQYSSAGTIYGYQGNVDVNVMFE